jgi:vacuolar-type H+-ATPase subunit I/STV1
MVKNIKPINWLRKHKKGTRRATLKEARKLKTDNNNISYWGIEVLNPEKYKDLDLKGKTGRGRPKGSKNKPKTELEKAIDPIIEPVREIVKPVLEPVIETAEEVLEPVVEVAQSIPTLIEDEKEPEEKRGRGRPKGSKNKPKTEEILDEMEEKENEILDEIEKVRRNKIKKWIQEMKTKEYLSPEDYETLELLT